MHRLDAIALALAASLSGLAAAATARRDVPAAFTLYAYGEGIGGYSLVYIDGLAHVGHQSVLNSSTPIPRFSLSSGTLHANPNSTAGSDSFSNATFFVPGPAAPSSQAGFVNGTPPSTYVSTGWAFYGPTLLMASVDGWDSFFSAESTGSEGIYSLNWNATSGRAIPLSVRLTAPSNES